MNIFFTNIDPRVAARELCDSHIRKQGIEAVQMLCTALHVRRFFTAEKSAGKITTSLLRRRVEDAKLKADTERSWTPYDYLYRPAHVNHPCNIWVRQSDSNFEWLLHHADEIFNEWRLRFKSADMSKRHASHLMLDNVRRLWYTLADDRLLTKDLTPPALTIPPNAYLKMDRLIMTDGYSFALATHTYQLYINLCKTHLHVWTPPGKKPSYVTTTST